MDMYPDEQVVVVDGTPVSYPGLIDGKFASGNIADPSQPASYIPAETVNLLLDNTAALLKRVGLEPNNHDPDQLGKFADQTVLKSAMFRNKLINGDFRFWQRGVTRASIGYMADRWIFIATGGAPAFTYNQQPFTPGQIEVPGEPKNFARIVLTAAPDAITGLARFVQYIESVRSLAGRKATLSFYAKADSAKSISVELAQNFGSGGFPSSDVYVNGGKINLSTSWQRFRIPITVPSIYGKTIGSSGDQYSSLGLFLWVAAGSAYADRTGALGVQTGTFDFANVQLEEGDIATAFEQRPDGIEWMLCQRFYETGYSQMLAVRINTGGGYYHNYWTTLYKSTKRIIPTITQEMISGATFGGWTSSRDELRIAAYTIGDSGVGINTLACNWAADAEY